MALKKIVFLFLLIAFFSTIPAMALEVPDRPEGRITDRTGTLNPREIAVLDQKLEAFEKETTNQIAVLLIPSLQGDSLEDFSIRLAEKWKIGQKGRNNGAILLIVKNEKKLRIEVGYGLEGPLPDALAGSIIRNEIGPRFKEGRFYAGIEAGLNAIMAATKGEYRPVKKNPRSSQGTASLGSSLADSRLRLLYGNKRPGKKTALSFRRFGRLDDGRGILGRRRLLWRLGRGVLRRGRRLRRRRRQRRLVKKIFTAERAENAEK